MRALSPPELLGVWERGLAQGPVERALTLLGAACPETSLDVLTSVSIGQRDACLMELREATFGAALNVYAECPHCAERLEFVIDAAEVRSCAKATGNSMGDGESRELATDGFQLRFRLPDSTDLTAAARCGDAVEARRLILHRCVMEARRGEVAVTAEELPEPVIAGFASHLAECEPQAELLIDLECPGCDHRWQAAFDIASFLWQEINALAKHLLQEVAALARAYGWREADILAMSAARREFYLEMVS